MQLLAEFCLYISVEASEISLVEIFTNFILFVYNEN